MVILPRSVFVHVPKTGGTWVERVLLTHHRGEATRYAHAGFQDAANLEERVRQRAHSFCFLRDPRAWYQSFWAYKWEHKWGDVGFDAATKSDDFNTFVGKALAYRPGGYLSWLYSHYVRGSTFVGCTENLRNDLILALEMAGEPVRYSVILQSEPSNVSTSLWKGRTRFTPEMDERLTEVEAEAFRLWHRAKTTWIGGRVPGSDVSPRDVGLAGPYG